MQEAAEIPTKYLVGNERFHPSKPDEKIITKKEPYYEWLLTSNDAPPPLKRTFCALENGWSEYDPFQMGAHKAYVQLRKCQL